MSYLYITEQGAYVRKKGGHIEVAREGELLDERVIAEIQCLVVFGGVQVTSDAMLALLDAGCDIAFMTQSGHFKGRVVSATGKNSLLRRSQYEALRDPVKRSEMSRRYVAAKIRNGMDVLDDYHRSGHSGFVFEERERLKVILREVDNGGDETVGAPGLTMESLLGFEGAAARLYFAGFGRCLDHGRTFPGRVFHPSTDPVNAMLSFGYSLIARELQAVLDALGLDPYLGFFHEPVYGRASLSLDLMEEFRHPLVDRLVLRLFNKRMLDDDDFVNGENNQVYLKKPSLKIFIRHYEEWANSANRTWNDDGVTGSPIAGEMSWRKAFWKQGEKLRHSLETQEPYTPFSWKEESTISGAPGPVSAAK